MVNHTETTFKAKAKTGEAAANANNNNNRNVEGQTSPEVMIQIYGDQGKSPLLPLKANGEGPHFQPGGEDEFEVSVSHRYLT